MIQAYHYDSDTLYIPIHLNMMIFSSGFNFESAKIISIEFLKKILDYIDKEQYKHFLLDFSFIDFSTQRSFKVFTDMLKAGKKNAVFCNLSELIFNMIQNDCKELNEILDYDFQNKVISNKAGLTYYHDQRNKNNSDNFIQRFINGYIRNFIKDNLKEGSSFLDSSNTYANKYISVKEILQSPPMYYLVVYEICKLVKNNFVLDGIDNYDKLICASLNGAVLATLVGQLLEKEVLYLMKLGPHLKILDKNEIPKKSRYLYISDMVCLGIEYKIAKTLVKINDSDIVGGVSVVKYLNPKKGEKIFTLVEINDNDDFEYRIEAKKMENLKNGERYS